MTTGIVESSKEASRGGFQGIKKIRGLLTEIKLVPPRFEDSDYGEPKDQIQFTLEDAAVLEMFPGEEEFELKDNKFVGWVSYAVKGKTPHANSAYIKVWVASAEALGKKPSDFVGSVVTLEKKPVVLFKKPKTEKVDGKEKPILDADGKKVYEEVSTTNTFAFVGDESAGSTDNMAYVIEKLDGLNEKAALRALIVDTKLKQFPEYKDKLKAGTLAEFLGMTIEDGKFKRAG